MEQVAIDWYAVITASVTAFILGALWYGPLFGRVWLKAAGLSREQIVKADMGKVLGFAFAFEFIMAYSLGLFLSDRATALTGALYGFLTGFAWVSLALAVNALFEQKTWYYILINGGYWTLAFTIMGLIIGAWP